MEQKLRRANKLAKILGLVRDAQTFWTKGTSSCIFPQNSPFVSLFLRSKFPNMEYIVKFASKSAILISERQQCSHPCLLRTCHKKTSPALNILKSKRSLFFNSCIQFSNSAHSESKLHLAKELFHGL